MKTIKLLLITLVLLVSFSCEKEKEKTITLTQEEFMVVYKNAYLKGLINSAKSESGEEFLTRYQKDSIKISNCFFK